MTKKEIVRVISEELGLTQQETKEVVQRTFDSIVETLVREGRIELRNFGVFEVKPRAARKARNPKTGQQVDVPEKYVVTFKPGKVMEQRVRQLSSDNLPDTWVMPLDHVPQEGSAERPNETDDPNRPPNSPPNSPSGSWQ
ncbi:MAG TPA: integration host factor subunit beta [Rhodopirellula baltica]|uniref:DNA-binding protein HU n=4 Tax=Rhodopirellula baltica TaxID=265606 RepID=F2AYW4_RHOBT|nr:HU family DNA-binding protein [Rhodopirellula baltica]EGF25149.1 DNA-binding protein HU [Rhodopirellula baltica WH47]EKK03913.1 DNA-binding protein HU [Rhodopirellula baltica SH28]ELP31452.1 Histone-like bacterial DNA-binding protein [Rhodopirellula baltica SWK14]CAD73100.1 probable DNA-binding protein HU [Rhodopirellula baltica SH 1]HBE61755.1 integration host factor subunit beta [Rhodopirellula baltica]